MFGWLLRLLPVARLTRFLPGLGSVKLIAIIAGLALAAGAAGGWRATTWYYESQHVEAWRLTAKNRQARIRTLEQAAVEREAARQAAQTAARAWARRWQEAKRHDEKTRRWAAERLPDAADQRMRELATGGD